MGLLSAHVSESSEQGVNYRCRYNCSWDVRRPRLKTKATGIRLFWGRNIDPFNSNIPEHLNSMTHRICEQLSIHNNHGQCRVSPVYGFRITRSISLPIFLRLGVCAVAKGVTDTRMIVSWSWVIYE